MDHDADHTAARHRRARLRGVGAALACGLVVAACGGSGTSAIEAGTGTNASNSQALAASECMRAHGIKNFPDPVKGPGGVGISVNATPGNSTVTVGGIPFSGPAFTAAAKTCRFGPGNNARPLLSAAQRHGMLENAECLRKHGVPNFPDPTFGPGGGVKAPLGPSINRNAPAFLRANQECHNVGVPLPGGG